MKNFNNLLLSFILFFSILYPVNSSNIIKTSFNKTNSKTKPQNLSFSKSINKKTINKKSINKKNVSIIKKNLTNFKDVIDNLYKISNQKCETYTVLYLGTKGGEKNIKQFNQLLIWQ